MNANSSSSGDSSSNTVVVGVIITRHVITPKNRTTPPFVKATLEDDSRKNWSVVWWNAGQAPATGERVQVEGALRSYNGKQELHANRTVSEGALPEEINRTQKILNFFRDSVEAEAAANLRVYFGASTHVNLVDGVAPIFVSGGVTIPNDQNSQKWANQRRQSLGETLLCGYPMVVGYDPGEPDGNKVAAPLFVGEVEVIGSTNAVSVRRRADSVDLNGFALDLLGVSREEREAVLSHLDSSPEFEEAKTSADQIRIGIKVLQEAGLIDQSLALSIDTDSLSAINQEGPAIQNSAALMVTTGGSQFTRMLVEDLEELCQGDKDLSGSPLEVFFGLAPAESSISHEVHPTVVPTSIAQDRALSAALKNNFTVVTGPPGTGKSQVLVNVLAASICQGDSVLFASKNNQAVDVVFDRIREVSESAAVVRAGASARRQDVALNIQAALKQKHSGQDLPGTRFKWSEQKRSIENIHTQLENLNRLESDLETGQRELAKALRLLPTSTILDKKETALDQSFESLRKSLSGFGRGLGFWGRKRKHAIRLNEADKAINAANKAIEDIGWGHISLTGLLTEVMLRPKVSRKPLHQLEKSPIRDLLNKLADFHLRQVTLKKIEADIARHPDRWQIETNLAQSNEARIEIGRQLHEVEWEKILHADPTARTAASKLADHLHAAVAGRAGARAARTLLPEALPCLPAWGVTNLSTKTNFPLQKGMFDLVIIDEASQCDVASAIPLLYRAKRALIIGDQNQLIHITQLGAARERQIASKWQLTEKDATEFSYRERSCFSMANLRVGASPHLLDLHFRSQSAIVQFSNEKFYGNQLKVCSDVNRLSDEPTLKWENVRGESEQGPRGRSWINRLEAEAVVNQIGIVASQLQGLGLSMGVVTPYRAQVELIQDLAIKRLGAVAEQITIDTVHRFQGDERDVMIFSPVVGPSMSSRQVSFAANPNLVNVALTRARKRLVIVGNRDACLQHQSVLADFTRYVSRLESSGFDSPIELALYEALLQQNVVAEPGKRAGRHRLDMAIEKTNLKLNIECDGYAFHLDQDSDRARDRDLKSEGWQVLRFSGVELTRELDRCVQTVIETIGSAPALSQTKPMKQDYESYQSDPPESSCSSCGREISTDAKFCGHCASPL